MFLPLECLSRMYPPRGFLLHVFYLFVVNSILNALEHRLIHRRISLDVQIPPAAVPPLVF